MSAIDAELTENERLVLNLYRDPAYSGIGRAVRLSVQYAVGAGLFVVLAIYKDNPWWSIGAYLMFLSWMVLRIVSGRKIVSAMPTILEKYDRRIFELESQLGVGRTI